VWYFRMGLEEDHTDKVVERGLRKLSDLFIYFYDGLHWLKENLA
jgi:hypothetical protein